MAGDGSENRDMQAVEPRVGVTGCPTKAEPRYFQNPHGCSFCMFSTLIPPVSSPVNAVGFVPLVTQWTGRVACVISTRVLAVLGLNP